LTPFDDVGGLLYTLFSRRLLDSRRHLEGLVRLRRRLEQGLRGAGLELGRSLAIGQSCQRLGVAEDASTHLLRVVEVRLALDQQLVVELDVCRAGQVEEAILCVCACVTTSER